MDKNERVERMMNEVDQVLRHIAEGGAGGTIGPNGVRLGMPDWEEQTKHLRPSERVRTHGYPLGFAKSQWMLRDRALVRLSRRLDASDPEGQAEQGAAHDAVARALDWERLLGSFNRSGEDPFPVASIDRVATNLLAWLASQGFRVVREDYSDEEPLPELESKLPIIFDSARGMVVLTEDQEEARVVSEDPVLDQGEDEDDEEGAEDDEDDGLEACPICDGAGEVGFSMHLERQCGGCAGRGRVSEERLEELDESDWTPWYSSIGMAREAVDIPWGPKMSEVYIEDLSELAEQEYLGRFNLRDRDLREFDLSYGEFGDAQLAGADHSRAVLDHVDLSAVDLAGVTLTGASFQEANLSDVDLSGRDLRGATFTKADLSKANLAGADLRDAKFHEANLAEADLRGAVLTGA